ncbi:signal peptidase I [Caloranaerobacter azorensis DSM 13643]|uniref:Signal peptidase I n=1 Tax=Caloranaerobacter azorensis DSM 13643 TaxID=1121264 RepID=A0A1M5UAD9_9FIRM|nr:signal peptidase I [Caloranaerobacter azorensis]SHH59929.1 signal peptidase I [Caloranaerobacter azorensis DSM 13643]
MINKSKIKVFIDCLKVIFITLVITILIDKYVISITLVKGCSMLNTINDDDRLLINKLSYIYKKPSRGDIIVFKPPLKNREGELFIKRVIALEGEKFKIIGNHVYINGELLMERYIDDEKYIKRDYNILQGIVPKGYVFVLGDNRNNSNDSRTFGFVPIENIVGKAVTKIWPIKGATTLAVEYPKDGDGITD